MRKPTLEPVFGKLGTLDQGGAIASALPRPVAKTPRARDQAPWDKAALIWLAVKVAIMIWVAAIVLVIFGWWPA